MENPKHQPHIVFALLLAALLLMPVLGLLADPAEPPIGTSPAVNSPPSLASQFKDSWKTSLVQGAYVFNPQLSKLDIEPRVNGNHVHLNGQVSSQAQSQLAEKVAMSVHGVEVVTNRLEITEPNSRGLPHRVDYGTDVAVTTKIKSQLLANRHTSGLNIEVLTNNHVVTLTGQVDNDAERELVLLITRDISGVQQVIDRLEVQPPASQAGLSDL